METNYKYDETMINEMIILMENDEQFYDGVRMIRDLYFDDEEISENDVELSMIMHAASYNLNLFVHIWSKTNTEYILQAEYFKACLICIPELMASM